MVPRTSSGRGFKGAAAYYLHDKGAQSANRIRFTHTLNLSSDDPRRAIGEMIYTAEHAEALKAKAGVKATGRKLEKPVYTFSLSWHPSEKPTEQQMQEAGLSALKALKMDHHQILMVAHNDTEHPHIHVIVNRVDPSTGIAHGLNKDQLILSKWASAYEKQFGKTWCIEREKNIAERQKAAREKDKGERQSAFVKNVESQRRDARPEYDRRAKAIKARKEQRAKVRQQTGRVPPLVVEKIRMDFKGAATFGVVQPSPLPRLVYKDHFGRAAKPVERAVQPAATKTVRRGQERPRRPANDARATPAPPAPPQPAKTSPKPPERTEPAGQIQQRQEAAKRERFAEWQTEKLNELQSRHAEQRRTQAMFHEERRRQAEQRIEKTYGRNRRADQAELERLLEREREGSSLSRLVDRMRGLDGQREALERNLANIEQRSQEILLPVIQQEQSAQGLLHDQQARERLDLEALFEQQAKAGYEIPPEHTPGHELDRDGDFGLDISRGPTGRR